MDLWQKWAKAPDKIAPAPTRFLMLAITAVVVSGCEELVDQYHDDRHVMKILRDGEYRFVDEEF
ncbi:hypothetical protein OEW28_06090 [Defluviimonas sp. WL0002]|uniref:Uncharacterized protein n=1 Tax=Albidovulum marisflavi TaxID=2984159 RepID=A0ABT2ZAV7_9RHOB|nr:hypothetical protein [Defluviimonas sp. WL0002]MCV2868195.1 hypothetical protein [Defluviimonas sp. WL0002]